MSGKKEEDDLVDAGSEYSFPASDPPSYMGGTLVVGPPPHDGSPPREPASHELLHPVEDEPGEPIAQGERKTARKPGDGGNNP